LSACSPRSVAGGRRQLTILPRSTVILSAPGTPATGAGRELRPATSSSPARSTTSSSAATSPYRLIHEDEIKRLPPKGSAFRDLRGDVDRRTRTRSARSSCRMASSRRRPSRGALRFKLCGRPPRGPHRGRRTPRRGPPCRPRSWDLDGCVRDRAVGYFFCFIAVQGEARNRPGTHSPRPLMRASCGVPVSPLTEQFIGRVVRDTRQRATVKRDDLQAQVLQGVPATRRSGS
jgi:hypothetical protein